MNSQKYYDPDLPTRELIENIPGAEEKRKQDVEAIKMEVLNRLVQKLETSLRSLEDSMNRNADSSQSLAKKVFWLNIVLVGATVVIAFAAFID